MILFTDLDGTLLDHDTYSYEDAVEGINLLTEYGIPLIMVSSKTELEMVALHRELALDSPFVFENGGGIAYPAGMGFTVRLLSPVTVPSMRHGLKLLEERFNIKIRAIPDMETVEVALLTGLPVNKAAMAMVRQTSLPFITEGAFNDLTEANRFLAGEGLQVTKGGRFFHLLSSSVSKGMAVKILKEHYELIASSRQMTAAIGDGYNDISLLSSVDMPYLVRKKDGNYIDCGINVIRIMERAGPAGFTMAVKNIIHDKEHIHGNY